VILTAGRAGVAEFAANRGYWDVFGGLQYWNTKYEARSVRQVSVIHQGFPGLRAVRRNRV